jgi:ABC-2 type transport system ATP-binding protein
MAESLVIDTSGLRKDFYGVEALRGLDLQVPTGSVHGFLGRNGAGKTTTIKILLGMARPSAGAALVFGLRADDAAASVEIRRRCGFVSEEKDLDAHMTVEELIRFTAGFFPRWRADLAQRYARKFDLPQSRKVKALSRGMRTMLAVLLALCHGAELLILDEPTAGLDPAMADAVLRLLVSHAGEEGTSIFFSSHQIAEVDQIADRVAIVDRGRTVVAGSLDDLRECYRRVRLVFDHDAPANTFRAAGVVHVHRSGRTMTIVSSAGTDMLLEEARAMRPSSVDVVPMTLNEIFLETVAAED